MSRWLKRNVTISTQLKLTVLMTFFDLIMTLIWVSSGNATEANPILRYTLEQSTFKFIFVSIIKKNFFFHFFWNFFQPIINSVFINWI